VNKSNLLNGGQVIIDYLIREKVPYLFGLCGHATPFWPALPAAGLILSMPILAAI
jgi:thiamine pyrophosphate-dependent acetolactate synthase large subunit-like protein